MSSADPAPPLDESSFQSPDSMRASDGDMSWDSDDSAGSVHSDMSDRSGQLSTFVPSPPSALVTTASTDEERRSEFVSRWFGPGTDPPVGAVTTFIAESDSNVDYFIRLISRPNASTPKSLVGLRRASGDPLALALSPSPALSSAASSGITSSPIVTTPSLAPATSKPPKSKHATPPPAASHSPAHPTADAAVMYFKTRAEELLADRTVIVDEEDGAAKDKAQRLTDLMLSPMRAVDALFESKGTLIALRLFETFRPSSRGDFANTCALMQRILQSHPDQVARAVVKDYKNTIGSMLHYLHHPHVPDCIAQLVTLNHSSTAAGGAGMTAGSVGMGGMMGMFGGMGKDSNLYSRRGTQCSAKVRRDVYGTLTEYQFMLELAHHVTNEVYTLEHSLAAAELLEHLLRTFACDSDGDELLHPIQKAEFVDALVSAACKFEWTHAPQAAAAAAGAPSQQLPAVSDRQKLCMSTLSVIAHLILKEEVPSTSETAMSAAGAIMPRMVPNSMSKYRVRVLSALHAAVPRLADALLHAHDALHPDLNVTAAPGKKKKKNKKKKASGGGGASGGSSTGATPGGDGKASSGTGAGAGAGAGDDGSDSDGDGPSESVASNTSPQQPKPKAGSAIARVQPVRHPGRNSVVPFGTYRVAAVQLLTEIVENDAHLALPKLPSQLYAVLIVWFNLYKHTNLYHNLFFRLVVAVVRSDVDAAVQAWLGDCKLVSALITHWRNRNSSSDKSSAGGTVLACLNVIRLQAQAMKPEGYLRKYLTSHAQWAEFQPELLDITRLQNKFATVKSAMSQSALDWERRLSAVVGGLSPVVESDEVDVDLGSAFAKTLGFEGVKPFTDASALPLVGKPRSDSVASASTSDTKKTADSTASKKKNKKKKDKAGGGSGSGSVELGMDALAIGDLPLSPVRTDSSSSRPSAAVTPASGSTDMDAMD